METTELMHYGVKGMKWGVRKTRKWATSKHQPSSARSSVLAGVYAATGSKRVGKALEKSNARDAANWQRAKKEYKEYSKRQANKKPATKNLKKTAAKGAEATAKVLSKVGQAYVTDQIFWGGMGTKIVKETVKAMGMGTITAYTMARGGYDIKWYDKQGRRVG